MYFRFFSSKISTIFAVLKNGQKIFEGGWSFLVGREAQIFLAPTTPQGGHKKCPKRAEGGGISGAVEGIQEKFEKILKPPHI